MLFTPTLPNLLSRYSPASAGCRVSSRLRLYLEEIGRQLKVRNQELKSSYICSKAFCRFDECTFEPVSEVRSAPTDID